MSSDQIGSSALLSPIRLRVVRRPKDPVSTQEQVDAVLNDAQTSDDTTRGQFAGPRMPTGKFVLEVAAEVFSELARVGLP